MRFVMDDSIERTPGDMTTLGKPLHGLPISLWVVLAVLLALAAPLPAGGASENRFETLQQRLAADGFDDDAVHRLYENPEVAFETEGVSLFFVHSEARLNYDQFTTDDQIQMARQYMSAHEQELTRAETAYGVNGRVITAIILVETQLGRLVGNRSILNTLSTMAALDDPVVREDFWRSIPAGIRLSRELFEEKVRKKSDWAYRELKSFLQYTTRENMDPIGIYGSYAGAMGISQFMPSNILNLARDGDEDGHIDLFTHADAIHSVANYLRHHGWRAGLERDQAYQVILRYNYSRYYADTILKISKLLEGG